MRILLVEDNADHRELMSLALTGHDPAWQVEEVASGEEALRRLAEGEGGDLVFLDHSLPGRDGLEVLEEIQRGEAPPPVVMVTGLGDEQVAVEAMKGGAYDYVVKGVGYLQRLPVVAGRAVEAHRLAMERKRAEEALRISARQWHTTFDAISDAVSLMDLEGRVLRCNEALTRLLGKPLSEIISRPCWELMHGTSEPIEGCPIVRMRETRRRETLVLPIGDRWFSVVVDPLLDEDCGLIGAVHIIRDITERKRAEEALRESEEKHRTLFETMIQGVVYQNADGHIFSANQAAERILGLTLDQMQGRTSMDPRWKAVHEDGSDFPGDAHPSMVALATGKEVHDVVMGVFNPELEDHTWININAVPQFRPGETVPYQVYTTFEDITERKQAEEALRESEKRRALATDAGQVGVWDWNLETDEIYLDPNLKAMLGYADHEIQNHLDDWGKHVHPDDVEQVMAEANAHLEGLTPQYEVVYRMLHKDGSIRWFLARGIAMRDANGKPYRVVGTDTDITERKKAEEESENIFNLSPDMVAVCTTEGKFLKVNPSWEKVLGYTQKELLDLGWTKLVHPDDVEKTNKEVERQLKGGSVVNFVNRYKCKDGSYKTLEWQATFAKEGIVHATARDITERKRVEEMKDNLIRDVSHELKTPLAKMQMSVEQLVETVGTPSIDRQKVVMVSEIVTGNVQRLQQTVDSILDLSSLESGRTLYHKTRIQPEKLIRQVMVDMGPLAKANGLELAAELPEGLPHLDGDREKLLRVLTNLVDNAVKFSDQGKIVVSAEKKAHEVEIAVSDAGRGIPRENLDRVFERFWQENPSIPGAGIGLAICKTIVEAHGGKIWAESARRGQGATVRFTLPVG